MEQWLREFGISGKVRGSEIWCFHHVSENIDRMVLTKSDLERSSLCLRHAMFRKKLMIFSGLNLGLFKMTLLISPSI